MVKQPHLPIHLLSLFLGAGVQAILLSSGFVCYV